MRMLISCHRRAAIHMCVLAIAAAITLERAQALRMTEMPAELQTRHAEPRDRTLSIKLPLRQPIFHWRFFSRQDFFAGKLVLHIVRDGESTPITIFENGKLSAGWQSMTSQNKMPGDVYFGFLSTKKYSTAPGDRIRIELDVTKDLDGFGPMQTGVLPAGTYTSKGRYSGLLDEYALPEHAKKLPEETAAKLRQAYEFKAFLETWEEQWPLTITREEGWLEPAQRQAFEKWLKAMAEEDAKKGPAQPAAPADAEPRR